MGTRTDWLAVLFLTLLWTIGMLTWGYIRRRKQHAPSLRTIPRNKRFAVYLMTVFLGFDFALLSRFGLRLLHGNLLFVLIAANIGLVVVVFGFRLLRPLSTR
jgi:hypothetical protein